MALDVGCVLPAAACAALGATCLAPVCLPAGAVPSGLLFFELAGLVPIICCAFWSPAAALGAFGVAQVRFAPPAVSAGSDFSSAQFTEWDEVDGKFVPVEEDTIMFSPEGEALYGEVYCPMTAEEEAECRREHDATMRRRSMEAEREQAAPPDPVCGPPEGSVGGAMLRLSSSAALACAAISGCPAGPAEGAAAPPPDARLKAE